MVGCNLVSHAHDVDPPGRMRQCGEYTTGPRHDASEGDRHPAGRGC